MMKELRTITPTEGRRIVNQEGVLILPEWDIVDVVVVDAIRKSEQPLYNSEE